MVWLIGTKIDVVASYSLQQYLSFDNVFILPFLNKNGGFILFWKSSISLNFLCIGNSFVVYEIDHPIITNEKIALCCGCVPLYYHVKINAWLSLLNMMYNDFHP